MAAAAAAGKGMEAVGQTRNPDPFYIYIGDDVLPQHPVEAAESGVLTGKQILWGCNYMEPYFLVGAHSSPQCSSSLLLLTANKY